MNVPAELKYSTDHEWTKLDGNRVRVELAARSDGQAVLTRARAVVRLA